MHKGAKHGLYHNIHMKRKEGRKPRKVGSKGAPSAKDFAKSEKTSRRYLAKKNKA